MHVEFLVLFILFCSGWTYDITIGSDTTGNKIYDEIRQASPAIWRQYENITVIAPENEVIGKIVITDMRPEKDGDVEIVDGGQGTKFVTIELRSPTVLRGYEFHIEVYSIPETVSTDSEEQLPPEKISTSSNNNDVTTELIDKATSEYITPASTYDISSSPDDMSASTQGQSETTESPSDLKENNFRPARETLLQPSVIANEPAGITNADNNATETEYNDGSTTEADITTASDEQSTPAPFTFDNSKNIPDYNSLSILDYIKNKESARNSRHTDDNKNSESSEQTVKTAEISETTPFAEENSTSKPDDDTVDLVPPEVDAGYNSEFTTRSETTDNPLEESTLKENVPRAGRGIDFDSNTVTEESSTVVTEEISTVTEVTTTTTLDGENDNLSIASIDNEQSRNTRHTGKELEENSSDDNTSEDKPRICALNETGAACGNGIEIESNGNVLKLNLEQILTKDDNGKVLYTLPIVLVIGSENKFPIIKIITEDSSTESDYKALHPTPSLNQSSEPALDYDNKDAESDKSENGDFVPSADYEQSQ